MLFDVLQIINHVHSILLRIAFSKFLYEFTGKLLAFITEFHLIVQDLITFFLNERALLVSGTAPFAVRQFNSLVPNIVYQSKIVATHITVHATNCN